MTKKQASPVEAVTIRNLATERLKERGTALALLAPVNTALLNLDVEKIADLKEILRLLDGGEGRKGQRKGKVCDAAHSKRE